MRVTITGASGTIGLYLVAAFAKAGHLVTACYASHKPNADNLSELKSILPESEWAITTNKDCQPDSDHQSTINWLKLDLESPASVAAAIEGSDVVVHAAAIVSFHGADRMRMYDINVNGTRLLVDTLLSTNPTARLIHISSVAALGKPLLEGPYAGQVTSDAQWDDNSPHSYYGKTKFLAELEVWRGVQEGLTAVILNPAIVLAFGRLGQSSTTLFKYVLDGKPFYTEGLINWVDAKDLALATLNASKSTSSDVLNKRHVLSAGNMTYKQFFSLVATSLGKKAPTFALKPWMAELAWRLDAIRAFLFRTKPFVTKEFARTAFRKTLFEGISTQSVLEFTYLPIEQSLTRIGSIFVQKVK